MNYIYKKKEKKKIVSFQSEINGRTHLLSLNKKIIKLRS
ncbi:hypothetical protein B425_2239 [Bacillus amyloliquefaciens]|nr:hypothetical protein B425_2239 [Bacillus amyloliquefaciens]